MHSAWWRRGPTQAAKQRMTVLLFLFALDTGPALWPLPPAPGGAAGGLFVQLRGSGHLAQGPELPVTGTREETRTWASPGATR